MLQLPNFGGRCSPDLALSSAPQRTPSPAEGPAQGESRARPNQGAGAMLWNSESLLGAESALPPGFNPDS
jgi:hypothetical protein